MQMPFNVKKCKVMHFGKETPHVIYSMNGLKLEYTKAERDLAVLFAENIKVAEQCMQANLKASIGLGVASRVISYNSRAVLLTLYKSLVRPHLAWSPHY